MLFRTLRFAPLAAVVLCTSIAHAVLISDTTKINVLRQYNSAGVQLVTPIYTSTGGGFWQSTSGNDGSGAADLAVVASGTQTATATYALPGPRTVGSYATNYETYFPASLLLEGKVGGVWTTLTNVTTINNNQVGTFAPQTVTDLRYTVTGPTNNGFNYSFIHEPQIFMATGQSVDVNSGYNFLRDKAVSANQSVEAAGVWSPVSGAGSAAFDGNYHDGHFHSQFDDRAFVSVSLNQATHMDQAHMGWYNGQSWTGNWELYTSAANTIPATQSLGSSTSAAIQAAGWTLQKSQNGGTQDLRFNLASPGDYKHLLMVWNSFGGQGALVELETFANPVAQLTSTPSAGSTINVGSVLFGGDTTLVGAINIQNTGSTNSTIDVTSFVMTGPDGALFTIPNFTPAQLTVGSVASILYDAKFLGGPLGSYSAIVTFSTSEGPLSFNLVATSVVPEPATGLLVGCGIAGLAVIRRRRRAAK